MSSNPEARKSIISANRMPFGQRSTIHIPVTHLAALPDVRAGLVLSLLVLLSFWNPLLDPLRTIQEDIALEMQGLHATANEQIWQGQLPEWNPYGLGGERLLADIHLALFYPGSILFRILSFPTACLWTWVLHYIAIALTTYAFARVVLGIVPTAASVAGIVFSLGGFSLGHCNHLNFVYALPWLPLLLLAGRQFACTNGLRSRLWWFTGLVSMINLILSGGTPVLFISLVALAWLMAVLIVRDLLESNYAAVIRLAFGTIMMGLFAVALTAFQLLPTIDLYSESARTGWSEQKLLAGGIPWRTLLFQLLAPGTLGNLRSGLWGHASHETFVFIGGIGLTFVLLSFLSIRSHRWVIPLGLLLIGSVVLALGDMPVLRTLNATFLGIKMRQPSRYVALTQFSMALLAAIGVHRWLLCRSKTVSGRFEAVSLGTFTLMTVCTLGIILWIGNATDDAGSFAKWVADQSPAVQKWLQGSPRDALASVTTDRGALLTLSMFVWCAGGFVVWASAWLKVHRPSVAAGGIIVWAALEVLLFGSGTWAGVRRFPGVLKHPSPIVAFLQQNLGKDRYYNAAVYLPLWENRGAVHALANVDGYVGSGLNVSRQHDRLFQKMHGQLSLLNLFAAKYILLREGRPAGSLLPQLSDEGIVVYENPDRLPRAYFVETVQSVSSAERAIDRMRLPGFNPRTRGLLCGDNLDEAVSTDSISETEFCRVSRWEPGHIEIDLACRVPRWLFVSTSFDKGWVGTLDTEPIALRRMNACFLAARVPEGHHSLKLIYRTPRLKSGAWISLVTLAVLGLVAGIDFSRAARTCVLPHQSPRGNP